MFNFRSVLNKKLAKEVQVTAGETATASAQELISVSLPASSIQHAETQ